MLLFYIGMLNPCPSGSPMTLPNSLVTALCTKTSQCGDGWCHQVG